MKRRLFLTSSAALAISGLSRATATQGVVATPSAVLQPLVAQFARGAPVREGRVRIDISPLVENGNSVAIEVSVESPMTPEQHVSSIAIFNEKNPQNDVAVFTLSPLMGRARVATRIRLAGSQQLIAVAKLSDGNCWTHTVDVLVTTTSCIEE